MGSSDLGLCKMTLIMFSSFCGDLSNTTELVIAKTWTQYVLYITCKHK